MSKKPNLSHVRRFECKDFVHAPKARMKSKYESREKIRILVGFVTGNSSQVHFPEDGTFTNSRDVKFDESYTYETPQSFRGKELNGSPSSHDYEIFTVNRENNWLLEGVQRCKTEEVLLNEDYTLESIEEEVFEYALTNEHLEKLTHYRHNRREREGTKTERSMLPPLCGLRNNARDADERWK